MAQLREFLAQLQAYWAGLSRVQRLVLIGVVVAAIALVGTLLSVAQQTSYGVVYSSLDEKDAGAIVAKLKDLRIPYQLADNGRTVRVPRDRADDVRVTLAGEGLPQGGVVGFELFNQQGLSSFGQTEFTQRLNLQRAMEGELSRTVGRVDAVESARVHLAIPQPSLFLEKEKVTTASVILRLRPARSLEPKQVTGIAHLLARSVEGLTPENITIVDTSGNVLSDLIDEKSARVTGSQREVQRTLEKNLERDITSMLHRVIGPNRAVVRVSAALNWDNVQQESELFVPPQTVLEARPNVQRSTQTIEERFTGPVASLPGGVPGAASNLAPGVQAAASQTASGSQVQFSRKDTISNYEISKTVEKLDKAPGAIERLSVAVMLDGPMDEARVQAIERTISTAAGIKLERGDVVTVAAMSFDRTALEEQERQMAEAAQYEFYVNMAKVVAAVLISFFLLLFLRSLLVRPQVEIEELEEAEEGGLAGLPIEGGLEQIIAPEEIEAIGPPLEVPEIISPEEERIREMEERLREMQERRRVFEEQVFNLARNNPEAIADLIKSWMEEEEEVERA
ncbi:MAG: flagellar M-ring protein FliF [Chloroflexi bacterium]|nr:flagellar M-ring protein FliF [Chloroflexota bacterium]